MSPARRLWPFFGILIVMLAAACNPAAASTSREPVEWFYAESTTPVPTQETGAAVASATPVASSPGATFTQSVNALATGDAPPSATATPVRPALQPSPTPRPPERAPSATPCPPGMCTYAAQFMLMRPIAAPGNDVVDVTYRFGTTQGEMREPHHGVEMLNPYGTTVLAAANGVVVVAGDDREPTSAPGEWPLTFYGPFSYFYGNLVVIEHQVPEALTQAFVDMPQPLYTLYAHLSKVSVETGQRVEAGQPIGEVGMAGVATGNHLHFEVRLGENTYESVRNPELWLKPRLDADGEPMGAFAARAVDEGGEAVSISGGIVLERLPDGPEQPHDLEFYLLAYEEKELAGQPPWRESFAVGDLPAGLYRVTFASGGVRQFLVQVYSGQLTVTTLRVE